MTTDPHTLSAELARVREELAAERARADRAEAALSKLAIQIEIVVPYVLATVSPHGHSEVRPDWIAIHKGRALSSYRQLEGLAALAAKDRANG